MCTVYNYDFIYIFLYSIISKSFIIKTFNHYNNLLNLRFKFMASFKFCPLELKFYFLLTFLIMYSKLDKLLKIFH